MAATHASTRGTDQLCVGMFFTVHRPILACGSSVQTPKQKAPRKAGHPICVIHKSAQFKCKVLALPSVYAPSEPVRPRSKAAQQSLPHYTSLIVAANAVNVMKKTIEIASPRRVRADRPTAGSSSSVTRFWRHRNSPKRNADLPTDLTPPPRTDRSTGSRVTTTALGKVRSLCASPC